MKITHRKLKIIIKLKRCYFEATGFLTSNAQLIKKYEKSERPQQTKDERDEIAGVLKRIETAGAQEFILRHYAPADPHPLAFS